MRTLSALGIYIHASINTKASGSSYVKIHTYISLSHSHTHTRSHTHTPYGTGRVYVHAQCNLGTEAFYSYFYTTFGSRQIGRSLFISRPHNNNTNISNNNNNNNHIDSYSFSLFVRSLLKDQNAKISRKT